MTELSKRFDFNSVEDKWCRYWEDENIFHAQPDPDKKPYTIVIPPPNVTGILHMGHALNNTLQDIIIRYKRMNNYSACWMPGTDHAGIATQSVVEKQLAKEGKTRYDLGREKLLERLWAWKKQYGDTIINQLKKIGASCDWPRTRFTMDDHYSDAVKEVFLRLYEKGLIYQGERIINWDPHSQTALADEEVEYREQQGALYHIRYPFKDNSDQYVIVATTRPETMLGDTAVAVNPNDERYKDFIGKTLVLPIIGREIQIIADDFVDPEFGTGAVKVTPAHDPNDFEMGQRHNLEFINIMHPDARMNENAGEDFAGMDRFEAREAVIETLKERKLLEKVEPHTHSVGHSYRSHAVIEPYLSKQWFVKMKPLAEPALKVVQDGRVKFHPDRWTKVYTNWMENIRDWCISRQIWWGHRVPVWYDEDGNPFAARDEEDAKRQAREKHGKDVALRQDEDVLDTWFSSWLWPFATFGWPIEGDQISVNSDQFSKEDLKYFYPGDSLFTASEIIFFWVARMIMAGMEFMGDIPFSDVYIHGTVRDSKGIKMSKSLGNAIDPLKIIREYGADALRFSLIINSGQDLFISKEKFEIGRNFANKIWNATRLILMNIKTDLGPVDLSKDIDWDKADLASKWIVSRFYQTLEKVGKSIESYRYSEAETLIYEFFWSTFCDWYLEIVKNKFADDQIQKITFAILEQSIRMMHPFIPYVTEEIWAHLNINDRCCAVQPWPETREELIRNDDVARMETLIAIVSGVRNIKTQWNIKQQQEVDCVLTSPVEEDRGLLTDNLDILRSLAKIKEAQVKDQPADLKNTAAGLAGQIKYFIPLGDVIDIEKEKKRILSEIQQQTKARDSLEKRLSNQSFLDKAPADVVDKEKSRLETLTTKVRDLQDVIGSLG